MTFGRHLMFAGGLLMGDGTNTWPSAAALLLRSCWLGYLEMISYRRWKLLIIERPRRSSLALSLPFLHTGGKRDYGGFAEATRPAYAFY